ncbi:FtsX-like permease family protein [Streptococcus rifensis]
MLYLKLALGNLKKAYQAYLPFILSSTTLFILLNTINMIWLAPDIQDRRTTPTILKFAFWTIAIFALIIVHYSHNFLMKQRSKEFGLYSVIGMNRKRIAIVAILELFIVFTVIMLIGSLLATVLAKFLYLILVNMIEIDNFEIGLTAAGYRGTWFFFTGIFISLLVISWLKIHKLSSLELLRSNKTPEKEPKSNALIGFLGVLMIIASYAFSLNDKIPFTQEYILYSFLAVLSVIFGTYLFFISFLTWLLRKRKNNKTYFYKKKHFIPTANMLYRMKQNAFGLANITVLASMVMATVIATASIFLSINDSLERAYPNGKNIYLDIWSLRDRTKAEEVATDLVTEIGAELADFDGLLYYQTYQNLENTENFSLIDIFSNSDYYVNATSIYFISLVDYDKSGNPALSLADGQIGYYHTTYHTNLKTSQMTLFDGSVYDVIPLAEQPDLPLRNLSYPGHQAIIILPDDQALMEQMIAHQTEEFVSEVYASNPDYYGFFFYSLLGRVTDEQYQKIADKSDNRDYQAQSPFFWASYKQEEYQNKLDFTGPFLFIGVIIGFSFLMGACLIMYYKQISEGHEDRKAYKVLQEIGMSKKMVRKTISNQILLIFFAPLGLAVIHIGFAMPLLIRLLNDTGVFADSIVWPTASLFILVFILLYYLVYRVTSRTYYKIIER